MNGNFDIPDPTDWLNTPVPGLSNVESPLHCQVCKDFFNTPMITSCSHTFCSLCIRKCLTEDGRCPTCRAEDQQIKLRRNWIVEELVEAFKSARTSMMKLAKSAQKQEEKGEEVELPKRKRRRKDNEVLDSDYEDVSDREISTEPNKTLPRRSSRKFGTGSQVNEIPMQVENDGLSACPICGKRMKEEAVFSHLDVHDESRPNGASWTGNSYFRTPTSNSKPFLETLPQLNYSLMKDQALRKKMMDLGIRSDGPKQLLISRHKEWVNLVNANSDSQKPRPKSELLKELSHWESTQGRQMLNNGNNDPKMVSHKDFDGKAWATDHSGDFDKLIAIARSKVKTKTPQESDTRSEADAQGRLAADGLHRTDETSP